MDVRTFLTLIRGCGSADFAAALRDELLRNAVADGFIDAREVEDIANDIGATNGSAAWGIREWYADKPDARDRRAAARWAFVAASYGSREAIGEVTGLIAAEIVDMVAAGGEGGGSCLRFAGEAAAALVWWSALAWAGPDIDAARARSDTIQCLSVSDLLRQIVGGSLLTSGKRKKTSRRTHSDAPAKKVVAADADAADEAGIPLDAWRCRKPADLQARLSEYRGMLSKLTAFENEKQRVILMRAISGSTRHALAVADILSQDLGQDEDNDLAWGWMAVAALGRRADYGADVQVARHMLVGRLLKLQSGARLNGRLAEVRRLARLLAAWLPMVEGGADLAYYEREVVYREWADTGMSAIVAETASETSKALKATATPATPVEPAGPSMVVVRSIDPGRGTAEDKSLTKAWEGLTKPVPLAIGPDPDVLDAVLRAEFPWLVEAVSAVVGDLRLRRGAGRPWAYWRPLLLVGPPGSGKTRFARRLAQLSGVGFGEVNAAGSSDNRLLQGTARGWSSATPSYVLQVIRREMVANPVILVDELDKSRADGRNGDIKATLLGMLEPLSARCWPDECLVGQCDISAVNWIVAANDAVPLRGPLLTRLRVVEAPAPNEKHFEAVLAGIRRDLAAELGVGVDELPPLHAQAEDCLLAGFRRGISLRRVRAALEAAVQASGGVALSVRH